MKYKLHSIKNNRIFCDGPECQEEIDHLNNPNAPLDYWKLECGQNRPGKIKSKKYDFYSMECLKSFLNWVVE